MPDRNTATRSARTVLELRIRERRQTFEEFSEYAEKFAREHDERGTLSVRHLQRLVAGTRPDGTPPGPLRPATARLLERIFCMSAEELLAAPTPPDAAKVSHGISTEVPAGLAVPRTVQALRVAIAIVVKESQVLIVCRRGADGGGISWQFPAGIIKPGVPPETVAIRETLGETGVHCVVVCGLGNRVHPITNVFCDYLFCEYLTGNAENVDVVENVDVLRVNKTALTRYIPADQIFPPVLEAIEVSSQSTAPPRPR